ncbi:MAG: hypothetical protein M3296_02095 [Actinomycetota bacterium]|nr:hypothetical protein [Actinomycetota bacterium]
MEVLGGKFVCVDCMTTDELIAAAEAREHRAGVTRNVLEDAGVPLYDDEDEEP